MGIPAIPLNPNGKLDRRALPALEAQARSQAGEAYAAPATEIEQRLVALWAEVLDINKDKIGMTANFFELGGHSLKATILGAKIHKAFDVKIPLVEIFRLPTVRESAQYIENRQVSTEGKYAAVEPVEKKEYYVLSSAQRRLYILQQMVPHGVVYNMPQVQQLSMAVDKEKLTETFKQLIRRHESLRTSFIAVNEVPLQKIHDEVEFEIEYYDLDTDEHCSTQTRTFIRPFDLSCAPLLRVGLIKTGEEKYVLMVDMHHIISDGVSQGVLLKEFLAIYDGVSLTTLRLHYKDFAEWQNSPAQREVLKKQEKYWSDRLAGELPVMNLPYDYTRPDVQGFEGSRRSFYLETGETAALKALAAREDVTLYMVLLAAFDLLSARLSGQEDIIVGVPVAGRSHADIQQIIGMFVNTLAVRNYPSAEKTMISFLQEVKTSALGAFENQDYPFEDLVEKVTVVRDVSRNPVFDVVFVLQNLAEQGTGVESDAAAPSYGYESRIAKFDMTLFAVETGENLTFSLEYCTRLFKEETIERFTGYFKNIINSIVENPSKRISDVEMLSEAEKRRLLAEFNDTGEPYPNDKTIHQLFEEQAARMPDRIALSVRQVRQVGQVQLSYCELNEQSGRLAGFLIEKGVLADNIVGIMMERSVEMIIGIFGILKAGGAYLPIDPDYPQERIDYILKDSGAKLLVTTSNKEGEKVRRWDGEKVLLEEISKSQKNSSYLLTLLPSYLQNSLNLAYIIYTSGSTGMPKGVMIEHRSVVNRLNWMQKAYPIDCGEVILQKTAFTFDVSVWELFWWSSRGACVSLLGPGEEKDPAAIVDAVTNYRVTTMHFVPSLLNIFLDYLENEVGAEAMSSRLRSLRQVFASGEALGPVQVERFHRLFGPRGARGAKLINLYGPTEATVDVSYFNCSPGEKYERIPIGKPIDNINLYVLDKSLHLQPVGVVGELYIAGVGLARGYLNRPELTAERFIDFHHSSFIIHHSNLYCTGDLARWLSDGNIEYLGRVDHQVKIRGFRIELGEIENRLLAEPAVKEAAAAARIDQAGDTLLAAYVVPDETVAFTVHRLLEIERNKLQGEGDRPYYELPNGMPIFYLNRNETDFMYREIFEERSYLRHGVALAEGSCIFDIGANIGVFSLFANSVCRGARIYSFEPAPALYDLLALNTSLYGTNFKIFKNGISSKEEEVVFTYYPHASILSGRFADEAEEKETVKAFIRRELEAAGDDRRDRPTEEQIDELLAERLSGVRFNCAMKTVSQVMRENNVERIDLLKIDVEKAELDVLEGIEAADWPKIRQLVIEVHDSGGRLDKIMDLLKKHGYKAAVEQDSMLEETGLYNLYAVQAHQDEVQEQEHGPRVEPGRYSPGRLIDELKESLKGRLPGYMIPSHFVLLDKMPLTASGKVDRKALPAPEVKRGERYEAPTDEIEEKLAAIWSEVLNTGKENIGVTARFFDLGGHSLKATVMVSRIYREFTVHVPLVQVFNTPTIRGLAGYLKEVGNETAVTEDPQLVRLKKGSGADPGHLFLVHDGSGEVEGYVEFCRRLELESDCWGIRAEKFAGYAPSNLNIEAMAQAYIEKIKTLQPQGPYRIAGWSLGGTIAFEMAHQLETMGETVSFLGLIDSPAPAPVPTFLKEETFTAESELARLRDYLPGEQIAERLKGITDINKTWWEVIAFLEENHTPVEKVRQLIPAYLAQIIPGYERLGLRELIYYLNLGRSLNRARGLYIPGGKIYTELHHFTAVDSKEILKESWAEYCHTAIKVYQLSGNHYSILKMPGAAQSAQLFSRGLSEG